MYCSKVLMCLLFLAIGHTGASQAKWWREKSVDIIFRFNKVLTSGKIYRIDNSNGLTLTALKEGQIEPQPVNLLPWAEGRDQLWEANWKDEGYIFTPLENDFNTVSYFLEKKADSYHVWKLGRPTWTLNEMNVDGMYLLRNAKSQCLEGFGEGEVVGFKTCQADSIRQYWKFYEIEMPDRDIK